MATTTFSPVHIPVEARSGRGVLRRILDHMIASREAEAKRQMARTFQTYSDDSLTKLGLTREELARWHAASAD